MSNENSSKVVTGLVRLSYANVWEPKVQKGSSEPKFSVAILIPKTDKATIDKIKKAVAAAEAYGVEKKWNGEKPKKYKYPVLRDGDGVDDNGESYPPEYHGHFFVNAKCAADKPPVIIGTEKDEKGSWKEITDKSKVYSGCYGRVSFNIYPYNNEGGKGLAAGLLSIQKIKDGEPLAGTVNDPDEDFDDEFVLDGEDDFLS